MNVKYECDGCGECCRQKLVDVYEVDVLREPRVGARMSPLREPGLDDEIGYLNCGSGGKCFFLDDGNRCGIYPTRPSVCVYFAAGSDECQEVRHAAGLPLLEPIADEPSSDDERHSVPFPCSTGEQTMSRTETKTRPVHEVRLGRIRAAIWANETQNGTRHNVTVSRIYKDGEDWKDSTSFGRDDLPLLVKVADQCHSWIFSNGNGANGNGNSSNAAASEEQPF